MTEQFNEQLSVLMDGELPRDSVRFLLRGIDADPALAQTWSRYQVARSCLRRQTDAFVSIDFSAAVMARIDEESVVISVRANEHRWLRWAAGGAVAASVAVAALVVSRPAISPESPARNSATADAVRVAPVLQERTPASMEQKVPAMAASMVDYRKPTASDPRLDSYLVRHYEATGQGMRSGMVPYVMLVAPQRTAPSAALPRTQETPANAQ